MCNDNKLLHSPEYQNTKKNTKIVLYHDAFFEDIGFYCIIYLLLSSPLQKPPSPPTPGPHFIRWKRKIFHLTIHVPLIKFYTQILTNLLLGICLKTRSEATRALFW